MQLKSEETAEDNADVSASLPQRLSQEIKNQKNETKCLSKKNIEYCFIIKSARQLTSVTPPFTRGIHQ
eukprot:gene13332-9165_t